MYRVELKVDDATMQRIENEIVPNVPCGVERLEGKFVEGQTPLPGS